VIWAVEFRDGLLLRFVPARTTLEAEAVLARPAEPEVERSQPS